MSSNNHLAVALPSKKIIGIGVIFVIAFWLLDSLIDTLYFNPGHFWESLQPEGMELYMRLLVSFLIIAFSYLASCYVETNNQLNRHIALSLDTQRKQAEADLRIAAFAFESLEAMLITNAKGVVLRVNGAFTEITGYEPKDFLGHTPRQLKSNHHNANFYREMWESIRRTGGWRGEIWFRRKNGEEYQNCLTIAALKDSNGTVTNYIGTHFDITERKRTEEALRQREQYQRALLDNFPFMVWLKDEQNRFLAVNNTFATGFGWPSVQSLIGKHDLDMTNSELAERFRADDMAVLASGTSKQAEELIEINGQRLWFETYKSPVAVDGRVIGIVGFTREITERKRIEMALKLASAEAEKANHAKSRFLAAASHDLRQPLAALALYVSVLKHKISPDQVEMVGHMQNCIDSLSELLTDLLDLSKLEAGVVIPKLSDFAVDEMLTNLVSVHRAEAGLKGLRLHVRNCGAVARTDPILFRRILGNLVGNAIRYTHHGGVLIACRRHQNKLWVEVWDTGIGIPANKTEIIFEEFRQLGDDARNRGSGLGLAIVTKVANLLDLQIRLRSRPGRGSMFAIELPSGQANAPDQMPTAPVAKSLRVALVEDNRMVLEALTLALEYDSHEVIAATAGALLIEGLAERAPDIVISDYRLTNGETGFDVITKMRNIFDQSLPAIIITGDTDPALVSSMANWGIAVHYKPLQIDAFLAAIREATEQRVS